MADGPELESVHYEGGCACGALRYAVRSAPYVCYTCHCRECQKLTGSAFATCLHVPMESFDWQSGEPSSRARVADSGNELTVSHCSSCGTALVTSNSARPRMITVYAGSLDVPEVVPVTAHIWTRRKLPWVQLPPEHRQFDEAGDFTADYAHDPERLGTTVP